MVLIIKFIIMITLFFSLPSGAQMCACIVGLVVFIMCLVEGIAAYMTYYHERRMSEPDEFQDRDDYFADCLPHYNAIDGVRTMLFQDVATLHSWIVANIFSEQRQVQLYLMAIIAHEKTGMYKITVELSNEERMGV